MQSRLERSKLQVCGRQDSNLHGRLGAGKLAKVWCPVASKATAYANSATPASLYQVRGDRGPTVMPLNLRLTFTLRKQIISPQQIATSAVGVVRLCCHVPPPARSCVPLRTGCKETRPHAGFRFSGLPVPIHERHVANALLDKFHASVFLI